MNKIYEDEIIEITEISNVQTIDIEVDGEDRTFFANDILTHNSGFESSNITMGMIAESAGLAATCDTIMAIIQTPDMNLDNFYWLKLLKVRDGAGKNLRCKINVDYDYMRLTETNTIMLDTGDEL